MPSDFDLLRSIDTEPRATSTVDVGRAISTARRRRSRQRTTYAGVAALAAVVLTGGVLTWRPSTPTAADSTPGSAAPVGVKPPTRCTVRQLPIPDGAPAALVAGADRTGRYLVGRSYPKENEWQPVIWQDGAASTVPIPGTFEKQLADVNASGVAVGWGFSSKTTSLPYVFGNGQVTRLPGVTGGQALAINDRGAIVGDDGSRPVLWRSATAQPTRLPVPPGTTHAQATDIDQDGTVVGTIDDRIPYVWLPDGTHHPLSLPDLDGEPVEGRAFHISGGWVSGVVNTRGAAAGLAAERGEIRVVRWNLRTGAATPVTAFDKRADAINAQGWQTGIAAGGGGAVLVADGTTLPLSGLAPAGDDRLAVIANAVSYDGRTVAGQADDAAGRIQPVVWTCS
ncbi:hypothetical protein ACWT_0539 [Actinoplanes sp. SE50]|uniref:hypothetical protein n=1 Tax=unclassified Actinoplanes TaxID=2626549 RepID=UPI00023ECC07|nr:MULTISPECIES: hypothetical protein [unclassified Actinoplanes]AEV81552.1 hypothetical protein ACPL_655 [Actinoplanes sp. SE50/110]ATO79954.1 hypothetical protein ACWT_0539 [Actinoplanes sp. SE50]SLL97356.1 hypothetical protein ACSP50_0557 [Actinoplanes sp. SE50/110]